MPYCTRADVQLAAGGEKRLVELTDQAGTGGVDEAVLDDAIAKADSWINGYVGIRRRVPLTSVPESIRRLAAAEVVYLLRQNRRNTSESDEAHHDQRRQELVDVSTGRATLGVDPQPAKSSLYTPELLDRGSEDDDVTAANTKGFW